MNTNYFNNNLHALDFIRAMVPYMQTIANPLLANTMITNFSYLQFNADGSVINLTTDINWIEYRFSENIKYQILFKDQLENGGIEKPCMYLWPTEVDNKLLGALHAYGIWNGCNIYIPRCHQIEVFSFASTVDNANIQNFYVNHFNLLNKFIIYFKIHMDVLMDQEDQKNKIITDISFPNLVSVKEKGKVDEIDSFFNCGSKKIQVADNVSLTYKEIACCYYLSKGLSIKRIGNKLSLSPRTVETHINNVKLKTHCCTTDLLLQYLHQKKWVFDSLMADTL